jgi:quercetin dioxygenase-like cupin family protein
MSLNGAPQMKPDACHCSSNPLDRPVVSGLERGPEGRSFTVRLDPGQELPPHRNAARVVITAVRGCGAITIGDLDTRALTEGTFVQLEPNAEHAVVAGSGGLELFVALVANCCGAC